MKVSFTSIPPPPDPNVIPLVVANEKVAVARKFPPLKVNCVATDDPGAVPKLASALIEIVPAEIVVIPE